MKASIFYGLIIGFASGILLRSFFILPAEVFVTFLATLLALVLLLRKYAPSYQRVASICFIGMIALSFGVLRTEYTFQSFTHNELTAFEGQTIDIEGVVTEQPDYRENSLLLTVTTEKPAPDKILVRTAPGMKVTYGDSVAFRGTIERPEEFEGTFGRTFKYPEYLLAHGITYTVRANSLRIDEHGKGNGMLAVLYGFKGKLIQSVERAIPEPASGLGLGLVLGEKRALGKEWTDIFRVAGLIHIVVLSGYNISIVTEFVMRVLSGFFSLRRRLFVGGVSIVLIVLMVGPSASVLRAALMAILVLLARATGKTYELSRALCFAGFVMLVHNPFLLAFDPGFQFSFLATLGLIYLAPEIEKRFLFLPTKFQFREFFVATVAAQIMVLPLLLYLTGLFSNVSVLANILVLPLVPVAMLITTLTAFVGLLSSTVAMFFGYGAYVILSYILTIAEWLSSLAYSSFEVPKFSFLYVILAYCLYAVSIFTLKKHQQKREANQIQVHSIKQFEHSISAEADSYEITVEETQSTSARSSIKQ